MSHKVALIFSVVLVCLVVSQLTDSLMTDQDYCKMCRKHTMCVHPEMGVACSPLLSSGLTPRQAREILDVHNELRRKVAKGQVAGQPAASNMRKLVYDAELAKVAQRWANQCTFGHDVCRADVRFNVGQNVYITLSSRKGSPVNVASAVRSWFGEVGNFSSADIAAFRFSPTSGHYTQVVWANTSHVGCGLATYQTAATQLWYNTLYVCNYGRAGNVVDAAVYEQGATCRDCPPGTACEDGLCVTY